METREDPITDGHDAWITMQFGEVATVLMLCGDIDAANVDFVVRELRTYTSSPHPVVIDTAELGFLSVSGFRALLTLDEERRRAGTHWAILEGPALRPHLRAVPDHRLPLVRSGIDALQRFAPVVCSERPLPPVVPYGQVRC